MTDPFTYSDMRIFFEDERPVSGKLRCDSCGKFTGHHTTRIFTELSEYSGTSHVSEILCAKCA